MPTLQECYKILGVAPQASPKEIRQAYIRLAKQWHPDSQTRTHHSAEVAQERFLQIQKAYEKLKQHQDSGATDTPPPRPAAPKTRATATPVPLNADIIYANASVLGRQGRYDEAIEELSRAIRINPNFALAYKYRGHLRSIQGLERQAEADLNKARILERSPSSQEVASPAEIEAMARKYATAKRRSRFNAKQYSRRKPTFAQNILLWSIVAVGGFFGISILIELVSSNNSRNLRYPIPIETPAVQS